MKTHTQAFKDNIKLFGRQIDSKIIYGNTELGSEELNSITPHFESGILKSVMKQLDIDSNVEIPLNTILEYQFGLKVNNQYEYISFGNYIVYNVEKQEDTNSYKITCYDKMLYSMKKYETLDKYELTEDSQFLEDKDYFEYNNNEYSLYEGDRTGNPSTLGLYELVKIQYPITIRDYIGKICEHLGLTFANATNTFVNYDKEIPYELYLDANGNDLGYTFRDVLDELAQATASTICINNNDELEIRYIELAIGKNKVDFSNSVSWKYSNGIPSTKTTTSDITTQTSNSYSITYESNSFLGVLSSKMQLKPNTQYTISFNRPRNTNFSQRLHIYDISANDEYTLNQVINSNVYGTPYVKTFTTGATGITAFMISTNNSSPSGKSETITNIQLEEGATRTNFEPYGDTIDEEYLKDVNVKFGEKYGPINSVVLSRGGGSDNIASTDDASIEQNGLYEIKITENQILNFDNRDEYLSNIFNQLKGLEYYINDYRSTGICYLDVCDRYNVIVGNNTYSCVLFNDEILVTQGLEENVYTDMPEKSETDYTKTDKTDRRINQAYSIVDKQNLTITNLVSETTQAQSLNNERILELTQRTNSVQQQINSTNQTIEVMQRDIIDGKETLKNNLVTIDINGINVSTNTSAISTLMTNEKFVIKSGETILAYFGYDADINSTKAEMDNLTITNYLTAGYHRIEQMEINGEHRTGWFFIG